MTSGQGAGGQQQGTTAAAVVAAGAESQGQQGGAPASASAPAPSGPGSWCVGCKVTLSTTLGEVVKGEVFAYDGSSKCLILLEALPGVPEKVNVQETEHHVRIINANFIKKVISADQPSAAAKLQRTLPLPNVCLKRAELREKKALEDAAKRAQQIGMGVSREAQRIFDGINKTLPCQWSDKTIVVLGEVAIAAPYQAANVAAVNANANQATLNQVKKILGSLN